MKIAIVLNILFKDFGGAFAVVSNQAQEFKKRGYDVFIFTTTEENNVGWREEERIKIYRIRAKNPSYFLRSYLSLIDFSANKEFKRFLEKIKPDIIHFHALYYHLPLSLLKIAKKRSSKVFLTAHDVMLIHYSKLIPKGEKYIYKVTLSDQIKEAGRTYNPLRNLIIHYYLGYVDKIFAVSDSLKKLLEINGIKNVETVHNGINVDDWNSTPEDIKKFTKKYNLRNKKILFFGGRLGWAKGGEQLFKALVFIQKNISNVILLIAAEENEYIKVLENLARALKIEKNIIFTGHLRGKELKAAYHISDISVSPSLCFETFGMMNLEAMACKKPVISGYFGGPREVVVDGKTGYLINPNNAGLMAEKILDLLKNPPKARQFGEAGYQRAKEIFSLDRQIEETLKWYNIFL